LSKITEHEANVMICKVFSPKKWAQNSAILT
jgi:hypothetical protein